MHGLGRPFPRRLQQTLGTVKETSPRSPTLAPTSETRRGTRRLRGRIERTASWDRRTTLTAFLVVVDDRPTGARTDWPAGAGDSSEM